MWKLKLAHLNVKPSNGIDALKYCSPDIFPSLKRVKSYLRNTMKEVNNFLQSHF